MEGGREGETPPGKKKQGNNKTQKRHVCCRPPGAKMVYFGVHSI